MAREINQEEWATSVQFDYPDCTAVKIRVEDSQESRAGPKLTEMVGFLTDPQFRGVFSLSIFLASYSLGRISAVDTTFFITEPRTAMAFKLRWS